MSRGPLLRKLVGSALAFALAACNDASTAPDDADASLAPPDAAPGPDGPPVDDGTPVRLPCTNNFGQALSTAHGRLDGTLVAIVPPGVQGCNGDSDHVHLQVKMNGSVYDVAINIADPPQEVYFLTRDLPLPDGAWNEGWHTGADGVLDYVGLGLHSGDFTPMPGAALADEIASQLADANHISVFMTGYGPDGGHDVHRRSLSVDGAIAVEPLSPTAHLLFFHFANQAF